MPGTIVLTGANGSAAVHTVRYVLQHHIDKHLVLTVRNPSGEDANTSALKAAVDEFQGAKVSIRKLDLASLAEVNSFAKTLADEISRGELPPLESIICNAFYWNLTSPLETTADGFEKTFQVNHIAHAALVLNLLGSFSPSGGRVVLFTSDAHWSGKNGLEKIPPAIPADPQQLAKPGPDVPENPLAKGFYRYAVSKLAILMWTYALNRHLEAHSEFAHITAVAINPGNLSDSRALRVNTPALLRVLSTLVIRPLRPLLKLTDPTMRTSKEAGVDIAKLGLNEASPGVRGFFTMLKEDTSSPDSLDQKVQETLWAKTLEWTAVDQKTAKIPA